MEVDQRLLTFGLVPWTTIISQVGNVLFRTKCSVQILSRNIDSDAQFAFDELSTTVHIPGQYMTESGIIQLIN